MSESMEDRLYGGPETVDGTDPTPEPSAAPGAPQEAPEAAPEAKAAPRFDERYREPLTGLLFLGRLEEEFTFLGHRFVVRTLRFGEHIEAGTLIKEALGTRVEIKAWSAAVAAAGIVSVDGQPLIIPLVTSEEASLRDKYNKVLTWYEPVVTEVYRRINALEDQVSEVMKAMGEAGGQGN